MPKKPPAKRRAPRGPSLAERLREAEETLDAIRGGQVDALVVDGPGGEQVFTLKGADRRFRQLVETMNEGALLVGPSGTIVYGNARFAQLVGVGLEAMIGSPLREYVAEAWQPMVDALLKSDSGKAEVELVDSHGVRRPVYVSATAGWDEELALCCLIVTDLSDQKRNQEMVNAERLTAQVIEQAAQGIVVCNPDGVIVRASQAALAMIGANPLLRRFDEAIHLRSTAANSAAVMIERVLAGDRMLNVEATLSRPDDGDVDVVLSAAPITDDHDAVLGCVVSFADITDQKRSAAERQRLLEAANEARAEAEGANRAKDQFLAMLGHELRNPLAPILTALEIMTMRGEEAARRERQIIERHVKRVVTLVGDLLDVSRIAQGKVTIDRGAVDLALVIDDAVESAAPLIDERRHKLSISVPAGLWVEGDAGRLCQVFANLLTNAARYTRREGEIAISASRRGGEIVATVRDNGVGIPADLLPSLFDTFVQGKRTIERTEGGLGLGLSIVRSLVQLHGGRVAVRSDGAGLGSEFEVRLPAMATAPVLREPTLRGEKIPQVPRRVLVVDDNVDAAELLAEAIERSGYVARTAYDGPSALAVAKELDPEIAVLDIGLPVMDGYELARRLRGSQDPSRPLRLYAVTGYGRDSDQRAAREAGFDGHFVKPIDLEMLVSTISRRRPDER